MFQSRAGGLAQKHSTKGIHGKQINIESGLKQAAESAKNSSLNERQRDLMSKFIAVEEGNQS